MSFPKIGYSLFVALLLIVTFHVVSGSLPQPQVKKKRIELTHSDLIVYDRKIIANADRLLGSVILSHNNVRLYCDSAYLYKDSSNQADAFGHVHIIQGDTLNLYGDQIRYDGTTRIATIYRNVKLVNKSITLTTEEMIFDLKSNVGNYNKWGKIVDTANVLVSKIGRYYSNEDLCFFKDSVKVTNKDFILTADTLKYNSKTERVFLVGPTHIVGTTKQGTLYSEKGWYDTRTNIAELYKSSRIMGKEQSLQGDTIFYSRNSGLGRARSRVLLSDTTNHVAITGRNGNYNEKTKIAFVTDSAVFMQFSGKDTLFLHADTLKSIPDLSKKEEIKKAASQALVAKKTNPGQSALLKSVEDKIEKGIRKLNLSKDSTLARSDTAAIDTAKMAIGKNDSARIDALKIAAIMAKPQQDQHKNRADSLSALADTSKVPAKILATHQENPLYKDSVRTGQDTMLNKNDNDNKLFMAYHHVRFYKKDLQGLCDSLAYQMKDSVMRLFKDPVLWSDVHQMTAEKIEYRPHKPGPDIAKLENNGFIISREDSIKFNQISGKVLIGYITNNELKTIEVNGNAITLYYLKNKDHYSGMNRLESSKITVYLVKSKIDVIDFFPKPEGKTIPLKDMTQDDAMLKGFVWREIEKPRDRRDIYSIDEKRKKIAGSEKKPASKIKLP
jgi:lipopolysaccharide export system protein LptA